MTETRKHTILRFVLKTTGNPMEIMARFHPQGQLVLNRTEWRGKEPRSCAVTNVKGRPYTAGSREPLIWDVEVSYRPKGTITYTGDTKYDGWTAMMLDRQKDGTLLDGHGKPLPEGQPPVYLPFEMFGDVEFNEIDFGEFIGESEAARVKHTTFDEVMKDVHERMQRPIKIGASLSSTFLVARRQRPTVKIILSNAPSGVGRDGFGTRVINVNNFTPQVNQVLFDHLIELVSGFFEGRYSIKNLEVDDFMYIELDDVLVDCTPNETGGESRFGCLREYIPESVLEEMAIRLMATFEVDITVVGGSKAGLVLKHVQTPS